MPKSVERHNAVVARAVDPDQSVFLIHFVGNIPKPLLVLAEHFSDEGDGPNMMNRIHPATAAGSFRRQLR